jgi:hypothetical protein
MNSPKDYTKVKVELNLFYLHLRDCQEFIALADKEKSKLVSFYARHAILSLVFAFEALINRILSRYYLGQPPFSAIERLSTQDKWIVAPLLCGKDTPVGKTFDTSRDPFQSFVELIKMRHFLVHPQPDNYVPATWTPWAITILQSNTDVPWIEVEPGELWPHTRFPKNPFHLDASHAKKAYNIFTVLFEELLQIFAGVFGEEIIREIDIIDVEKQPKGTLTIESLWGGYSPSRPTEDDIDN